MCQSRTTAAGQPRPVTKIADTPSYTTDFANNGQFKENEKEILQPFQYQFTRVYIQGGSNMTGTDLCVNKPHCAAAVRP